MYTHIKNISTILRRNNGQLNAVKGRKCNIYNSKLERTTNLASKELIDRYRRKKTKKKKPNCFILAWFGRTHETPFYSSSERIWCFKYKDTVWFAKKKKKYSKIFWFRSCVYHAFSWIICWPLVRCLHLLLAGKKICSNSVYLLFWKQIVKVDAWRTETLNVGYFKLLHIVLSLHR